MPAGPIDDKGSVFYYEDSGAPADNTEYVTLVLIHGTCFHGAVYRRMIPFAVAHNMRLVILNMRGYPGTTPFSPESLQEMAASPRAALRSRGFEIAHFLQWYIQTAGIPSIQEFPGSDKLVGGLSILSWSGGNGPALSMLAHAGELPSEFRDSFNAYIRSFVLYDPSSTAVGSPPPPGLKNVNVDRSLSIEDQALQFGVQVGSYYPRFTLPDSLDAMLSHPPRAPLQDSSESLDPKYAPTVGESKMTREEFLSMTHSPIMSGPQHVIWSRAMKDAFAENVARALYDCRFDDGSGMRKEVWPAVRVHVVWCDMTCGEAAWGTAVVKCGYAEAKPDARRPVEFHVIEGANHFVQWEEPEMFVKLLAGIV